MFENNFPKLEIARPPLFCFFKIRVAFRLVVLQGLFPLSGGSSFVIYFRNIFDDIFQIFKVGFLHMHRRTGVQK